MAEAQQRFIHMVVDAGSRTHGQTSGVLADILEAVGGVEGCSVQRWHVDENAVLDAASTGDKEQSPDA